VKVVDIITVMRFQKYPNFCCHFKRISRTADTTH